MTPVIPPTERSIGWPSGTWLNAPPEAVPVGSDLVVAAAPMSDLWRTTAYGFVHDDGHGLLHPLSVGTAVEVSFRLDYDGQFDQAGVLVRADSRHWVKAGVEYADGFPQLGSVVTHEVSDWSVGPVPAWVGEVVTIRVSRSERCVDGPGADARRGLAARAARPVGGGARDAGRAVLLRAYARRAARALHHLADGPGGPGHPRVGLGALAHARPRARGSHRSPLSLATPTPGRRGPGRWLPWAPIRRVASLSTAGAPTDTRTKLVGGRSRRVASASTAGAPGDPRTSAAVRRSRRVRWRSATEPPGPCFRPAFLGRHQPHRSEADTGSTDLGLPHDPGASTDLGLCRMVGHHPVDTARRPVDTALSPRRASTGPATRNDRRSGAASLC